jgi:hypothetical protein
MGCRLFRAMRRIFSYLWDAECNTRCHFLKSSTADNVSPWTHCPAAVRHFYGRPSDLKRSGPAKPGPDPQIAGMPEYRVLIAARIQARAGAAESHATAKFCSCQSQDVPHVPEQGHVGVTIELRSIPFTLSFTIGITLSATWSSVLRARLHRAPRKAKAARSQFAREQSFYRVSAFGQRCRNLTLSLTP